MLVHFLLTKLHYDTFFMIFCTRIILYRKYLVSLDLSYNLLCDLSATAEVLVRLHSLRTLQLKGNPLAVSHHSAVQVPLNCHQCTYLCVYAFQLVPCYRSYVTDSLSKLMRLDDADITVNDQQTASSMRTHCELHTCECTVLATHPIDSVCN